jgi:DNA repair ATPase RecN
MRTKTTLKILSETSEETKEKVRNNANNLIKNHYQEINDIVHENQGNLGDITNQIYEWFKRFEYDYSKNCECETRIGETWCCNQCGLPTTK